MTLGDLMVGVLQFAGAFGAVYFFLGIYITARRYPAYSHRQQFVSELGAIGSPTQRLSPRLNNYPLALVFIGFGGSILARDIVSLAEQVAAFSIVVHGVATAMAGYFAMDKDPYISQPSRSGQLHGVAGLWVMISLLIAPLSLLFSASFSIPFKLFSMACVLLSLLFLGFMVRAYRQRHNAGWYQRLCYGSQLLWLAVLSLRYGFV